MPFASQETIDRVTNVLLNGNYQMKQGVLRTTPISPPHGDVSMFTNAQLTTGAFGAKLKLNQADATLAKQLEQRLEANPSLTKLTVAPWGAVFGLRDGAGNWTFTLVRHASVTARKITIITKKRFLRSDKVTRVERGEIRPSQTVVRDAQGFVDLTDPGTILTEQDHATCVNLGFSEFFPGAGAAAVRNLTNTQIF